MDKKKRILVFGFFGYITNKLDGQTVKTRAVFELLRERYDGSVDYADSQQFRHSVRAIVRFFVDLVRCDTLLWLPAHNNFKYLFPFIWLFSKIFRFDIIYAVVGGWLSNFISTLPLHRYMLRHIKVLLVENSTAKQELHDNFDIDRCCVFPNFREISPAPIYRNFDGKLKLVFMARIHRMKGLETIAGLCSFIKSHNLGNKVSLDFYGPIHKPDCKYFASRIVDVFDFVRYNGPLNPTDIHASLQNYDMMLLPTRYFTEGFPGSVLDAYRAGIPVAVTAWKHAREFVADGKSGFIVDFDRPLPELCDLISDLADNPRMLFPLKEQAYRESLRYTPDIAWQILSEYL